MASVKKEPLVSVVLPTYNGENYLAESIESVLNQTFTDWELIIVDDCSTDGTPKIAEKYAAQDSRIRVLHNEVNKRLPASLNIGFHNAQGKFLTWTSDDNRYLPNALEKMQNKLMDSPNLAMVCADCVYIDEAGNKKGLMRTYEEDTMLLFDTVGACFMYKREILDTVGDYDNDLFCVEDFDYWQRILKHYGHIERLVEVLYQYRVHDNSLSMKKQKYVQHQLSKLYNKNINDIFNKFEDNKKILCQIYFEMRLGGYCSQELQQAFIKKIPELENEEIYNNTCNYVLFGAGNYGQEVLKFIGVQHVLCIIDNDREKMNKRICDIPIMSLLDAMRTYPEERIMITVDASKMFEIICQLAENGKRKYTSAVSLLAYND